MTNFNDLQKQLFKESQDRRLKSLENYSDKDLVAIVSSPTADYRQVVAAKKLLVQHGVIGIPA